jgi:hypothetical protein
MFRYARCNVAPAYDIFDRSGSDFGAYLGINSFSKGADQRRICTIDIKRYWVERAAFELLSAAKFREHVL